MALPEIIKDINARILRSGDTMTGILGTISSSYEDSYSGALNLNNSDIYNVNSIYTADAADGPGEGIHFYRSATAVDTLWAKNGVLYFTPNRVFNNNAGPHNTILHTGNINDTLDSRYANVTGDTFTGNVNFKSTINSFLSLKTDTVTANTSAGIRNALHIFGASYGNDATYVKDPAYMSWGDPGP